MKKIDLKGLSIKMSQNQMKMILGGGSCGDFPCPDDVNQNRPNRGW
ncbi:MAG: rSAM-modified peptide [Bacteroidales bacterium]|nr:rSAM-modified peptide [Bacteroidales bacterium]